MQKTIILIVALALIAGGAGCGASKASSSNGNTILATADIAATADAVANNAVTNNAVVKMATATQAVKETASSQDVTAAAESATPVASAAHQAVAYKDATYDIDGKPVTLADGVSEVEAAPGSASKIVTRYFGNEARGDLNGDGVDDVAFLLTRETGGSGTFFYVAAALKTESGYQGTSAVFLGDRIAPQATAIEGGKVIVNYADRKPDEPFSAQPSVGATKYLKVVDGKLIEVDSFSQITD